MTTSTSTLAERRERWNAGRRRAAAGFTYPGDGMFTGDCAFDAGFWTHIAATEARIREESRCRACGK